MTVCRQQLGSSLLEVATASTADLQDALQKVTAELEDANRELHDLREVLLYPYCVVHVISLVYRPVDFGKRELRDLRKALLVVSSSVHHRPSACIKVLVSPACDLRQGMHPNIALHAGYTTCNLVGCTQLCLPSMHCCAVCLHVHGPNSIRRHKVLLGGASVNTIILPVFELSNCAFVAFCKGHDWLIAGEPA